MDTDISHRPWECSGGREPGSLTGASPKDAKQLWRGARQACDHFPSAAGAPPDARQRGGPHSLDSGLLHERIFWPKDTSGDVPILLSNIQLQRGEIEQNVISVPPPPHPLLIDYNPSSLSVTTS